MPISDLRVLLESMDPVLFPGPYGYACLDPVQDLPAGVVPFAIGAVGISANVIAGYHHDHFFVPAARADDTMAALRGLAAPVSR